MIIDALAFKNTGMDLTRNSENPDVLYLLVGSGYILTASDIEAGVHRLNNQIRDKWCRPLEFQTNWNVVPMLVNPKSVGKVELRSTDPLDQPKITGNFLSSNRDVEALIIAIKSMINITQTRAAADMGLRLYETPIPGCEDKVFNSDDYWECAVRTMSFPMQHQTSTVKMGPPGDSIAVVDNEGKVYGVKRLRCADESVIPLPIAGLTRIVEYMIAERISDFIKAEWLL